MTASTDQKTEANSELAKLSDEFFQFQHTADPFSATMLGVSGFDGLVPDVSRSGTVVTVSKISDIESRLEGIDALNLNSADQINHAVLGRLAWGARTDLENALWEASASASGYSSPQAMMFMSVPTAPLNNSSDVDKYLERLSKLPAFLDTVMNRHREANSEGRFSTRVGVGQAIDQLSGHLGLSLADDTLLSPKLPAGVDHDRVKGRAAEIVTESIRPAMRRLLAGMQDELLPLARPDDRVGIRFIPGGESGYRDAIRRHTTTDLTPAEIHQIGLDSLADLKTEWAELGGRVFGTREVPEILSRLRNDRSLRFTKSSQIVDVVTDALHRAEEARNDWFPAYQIADCTIEEINPIEAGSAALAHYRGPSADGSRAGAHCVLTTAPKDRFLYEYEALAFHESTPGHHLQLSVAQTLTHLPAYRRFLDAEVCGYVEGWGLYSERLADEMGLYTSDISRLGMLSFDALRACRLVVDTGIHHLGWSRQHAMEFMWENTATTRENVRNEIDRYISWPGQALAYMIGRREISRLRTVAKDRLGSKFDIRAFHGTVLGNGAVPLGVLEQIVLGWIETTSN